MIHTCQIHTSISVEDFNIFKKLEDTHKREIHKDKIFNYTNNFVSYKNKSLSKFGINDVTCFKVEFKRNDGTQGYKCFCNIVLNFNKLLSLKEENQAPFVITSMANADFETIEANFNKNIFCCLRKYHLLDYRFKRIDLTHDFEIDKKYQVEYLHLIAKGKKRKNLVEKYYIDKNRKSLSLKEFLKSTECSGIKYLGSSYDIMFYRKQLEYGETHKEKFKKSFNCLKTHYELRSKLRMEIQCNRTKLSRLLKKEKDKIPDKSLFWFKYYIEDYAKIILAEFEKTLLSIGGKENYTNYKNLINQINNSRTATRPRTQKTKQSYIALVDKIHKSKMPLWKLNNDGKNHYNQIKNIEALGYNIIPTEKSAELKSLYQLFKEETK